MGHLQHPAPKPRTQVDAWGIAAVTQALTEVRYPCTKEQVLAHLAGHAPIHWSETRTIAPRDLIAHVAQESFDSQEELARAVQQAAIDAGLGQGGKKPQGAQP